MARLTAFIVWALASASAVFWGLRVFSQPLAMPAHAQPVATSVGSPTAVARMFEAAPDSPAAAAAPPPESSRFKLIGLMAPRKGQRGGVALISVDGKPPRAVRSGATVADGFVVRQVAQRSVTLAPAGGGSGFTLELPPLPEPNTGVLSEVEDGVVPAPRPARAPVAPAPVPASPVQPAPAPAVPPAQPVQPVPPAEQRDPQDAQEIQQPDEEEPSHRRPS